MASESVRQNQGGFPHHCKLHCPWKTGGITPLTKIAIRGARRARIDRRPRRECGRSIAPEYVPNQGLPPRGDVAAKSTPPRGVFGARHVHRGTSAPCRDDPAAAVG